MPAYAAVFSKGSKVFHFKWVKIISCSYLIEMIAFFTQRHVHLCVQGVENATCLCRLKSLTMHLIKAKTSGFCLKNQYQSIQNPVAI